MSITLWAEVGFKNCCLLVNSRIVPKLKAQKREGNVNKKNKPVLN